MSLRLLATSMSQDAVRGVAIAAGGVSVVVWVLLGYGWHLGPGHKLIAGAKAHQATRAAGTAPIAAAPPAVLGSSAYTGHPAPPPAVSEEAPLPGGADDGEGGSMFADASTRGEAAPGAKPPAGLPAAVVNSVNAEVNRALALPALKKELEGQGLVLSPASPDDFARLIRADIARWARVVKESGARAD